MQPRVFARWEAPLSLLKSLSARLAVQVKCYQLHMCSHSYAAISPLTMLPPGGDLPRFDTIFDFGGTKTPPSLHMLMTEYMALGYLLGLVTMLYVFVCFYV